MLDRRLSLLEYDPKLFILITLLLLLFSGGCAVASSAIWGNASKPLSLISNNNNTASPIPGTIKRKANINSSVAPVPKAEKDVPETEKIGVVATVNGESITLMDVLEVCGMEEARLPSLYKGEQLKKEVRKLRLSTLNVLIDRKLVYQEFKEKGYKLPKSFVEKNLDYLVQVFNVENRQELEKELKKHGSSMAIFKKKAYEKAAVDALTNDICYRDVYITPKQVYDYYIKNKDQFTSPGEIRLQVLKLKANGVHKEELDVLSEHLSKSFKKKDEKEFNDAVLLYSEGPNVEKNGDIGWIDSSKLRSDFKSVVKNVQVGDIFGPIESVDAYYFLRVAGIKRKKTESFKEVKEKIKNKLTGEQRKKDYKAYIGKLHKKAYIKRYL